MDAETNTPDALDAEGISGETPKLIPVEEVSKVRAEAAKWRTQYRAAQAKLAEYEATPSAAPEKISELEAKIDRLEKEQAQRDADIKAKDAALLRQRIGSEFNLPAKLIDRLQGADEDSIRADAQALAEELPKPAAGKLTPGATAGVPSGAAQGVTREQLLQKMYGRKRHTFSAPASDAGADGETPKVYRRGG